MASNYLPHKEALGLETDNLPSESLKPHKTAIWRFEIEGNEAMGILADFLTTQEIDFIATEVSK